MSLLGFGKKRPDNPEGQMELVEHLAELRGRIFRSLLYLIAGMVAAYFVYTPVYRLVIYPMQPIMEQNGWKTIIHSIQDAFLLKLQTCFIAGLLLAFPAVVLELWGFIRPALTPEEQKPVRFLAPFSVLLFLAGVGTAYASLPSAYGWMASYVADVPDAMLFQDAKQYLLLTIKILLAFGVAFQLPIVLLFLARVGLITAGMMVTYWRHAIVLIATVAAVLTPSNDPLTMMMMAVPMAGLYVLSIGLVRAFEPRPDGTRALSLGTMLVVVLAPVAILMAAGYWLWRNAPSPTTRPSPAAASPSPSPTPSPKPVPAAVVREEIDRLKARIERLEKAQAARKGAL